MHQTVRDQVDIDLGRTFPENSRYNENVDAQETLRRVLLAYARHNPSTGYCQGMNYIGAFLWLVMGDEESVFWVFVCLLDDICQPGVHASDIKGTMSEYKVLHKLLGAREPKLQVGVTSPLLSSCLVWCVYAHAGVHTTRLKQTLTLTHELERRLVSNI